MDGENRRIVIVDDDALVREGMEMIIDCAGHGVRSTDSGLEALRWLDEEPCDLLIIDFSMREMDGPESIAVSSPDGRRTHRAHYSCRAGLKCAETKMTRRSAPCPF